MAFSSIYGHGISNRVVGRAVVTALTSGVVQGLMQGDGQLPSQPSSRLQEGATDCSVGCRYGLEGSSLAQGALGTAVHESETVTGLFPSPNAVFLQEAQ